MNLYKSHKGEARACRRFACILSIALCCLVGCDHKDDESPTSTHPPFCGGAPHVEPAECARPWLPHIAQVPLGGRWRVSHSARQAVRIGVASDPKAQTPTRWLDSPELIFDQLGSIKVFVEVEYDLSGSSSTSEQSDPKTTSCDSQRFSHVYEVVDGYSAHAESPDSDAISMDDPRIIEWASELHSIHYGVNVSEQFQDELRVLGPAEGGAFDALSLGSGGEVTLYFPRGIANGPGPDFAIFENSFNDYFLELARVEVSTDGVSFASIPHAYLGGEPLGAFSEHDPTLIDGLAGKHRAGYGTPFDLSTLAWSPEAQEGSLDLHAIHYVRVVDIVGDGSVTDSFQRPIYDPYPTQGSAGIDIDAIGVIYTPDEAPCPL